jgi:hypothetical protein
MFFKTLRKRKTAHLSGESTIPFREGHCDEEGCFPIRKSVTIQATKCTVLNVSAHVSHHQERSTEQHMCIHTRWNAVKASSEQRHPFVGSTHSGPSFAAEFTLVDTSYPSIASAL